jgi:protein SCO1/2
MKEPSSFQPRNGRAPFSIVFFAVLIPLAVVSAEPAGLPLLNPNGTNAQTFSAQGVVQEVKSDGQILVIKHNAISNYMDAMTMPFKVKEPKELAGLQIGDEVSFQLHVTETESWVDQITKTGTISPLPIKKPANYEPATTVSALPGHPLLFYKFTNELGQAVSLNDFRGQALAITFFYTRCPLPDYCPRLSKNFQEASQKLESMANAPTNWHFLSVSFDPEFDSPEMLKAYGKSYSYDPDHWSFLTGPPDKIGELARLSGVTYELDAGTINHNFRTLIIDANNHLQTVFQIGGDLSDAIVAEILKAAAVTNGLAAKNADSGGSQSAKPASNQPANPVAR